MRSSLVLICLMVACSSKPEPSRPPPPREMPPAPEPPAGEPPIEETQEVVEPVAVTVPTTCAAFEGDASDVCTPPADFVEALCKKRQPNVALTLFQKGSRWTRTYVRVRNMEAWLVGARRTSPAKLKLFEEVIIVADRRAGSGGVQVSGAGSFDVVRWDGSCVSVMSDEVNTRRPGAIEVATIPWKQLDPNVRKTLEQDKRIAYREEKQREHCQASKSSQRCVAAQASLSQMVAAFIRDGGSVPSPNQLE